MYNGVESFKIQFGNTTLSYNPVSKESKWKPTRFGADMVLISANHADFNGADQNSFGDREPFVISGPGEYEVKEVFIKGIPSVTNYGGKEGINTIYTLNLDNINLCFLGALSTQNLEDKVIEAIDIVDVLFVPIGGEGVLEATESYKLAVNLEPKVIIPMHFGLVGKKDALKIFLKEGGEKAEEVDKLTIKKKDIEGKEAEIIVLKENS